MSNELHDAMVRIGVEALKKERDDLVNGINRIQLTAVKWAKAFGGDTKLAIIARELRDLIGSRAISPSSPEGLRLIEGPAREDDRG
jgi:hypothetical protein